MVKSKKFILSGLICFAFILCCMFGAMSFNSPMSVYALGTEEHNHTDWTGVTELPTEEGDYNIYLTDNITLSDTWNVPTGETNLCLNGHVINTNGGNFNVITVGTGATLNLYDCGTTEHSGYVDSTGLWHYDSTGIQELQSGETAKAITGGIITGGNNTENDGGGVIVNGEFNMFGGTIAGNIAGSSSQNKSGGGVYVNGTFTMTGGTITGNYAKSYAAGVYVNTDATFTMTGNSVISNNNGKQGAGVYSKGTFTMSGNSQITGNTSGTYGGGVGIGGNTFSMIGGRIDHNTGTAGGGVYVNTGTFTMTGGRIDYNTGSNIGGVFVAASGNITLGGTAVITENVVGGTITNGVLSGGTANNVYLPNGKTITLGTKTSTDNGNGVLAPTEDMNVGITLQNGTGNFATGVTEDNVKNFSIDNSDYELLFNESTQGFECYHIHDDIKFSAWTKNNALPSDMGSYVLTCDITLSSTWNVPAGTTNLCLNGFVIKANGGDFSVITVGTGATLKLYDCDTTTTHYFSEYSENEDYVWVLDDNLEGEDIKHTVTGGVITGTWYAYGVHIDGGKFTLNGGSIVGNYSTAVYVTYGDIVINDGSICGNNGCGLDCNESAIAINGGSISKNNGAGIYADYCSISMSDGEISNNYGAGVFFNAGHFEMNGGTISDNQDSLFSAGVNNIGGTFVMNGGTISGNVSDVEFGEGAGGGVYVFGGQFIMNDGLISENKAYSGGGVLVDSYGSFIMNGGEIIGNESTTSGGGVCLVGVTDYSCGEFVMHSGSISDNFAGTCGGGVAVQYGFSFRADGGIISNNKTYGMGGGVYIAHSEEDYNVETCLAIGTPIAISDGNGGYTYKNIEELDPDVDKLYVLNHDSGELVKTEIFDLWMFPGPKTGAFTLHFEGDVDVTVVGGHCFFEYEANKYVNITAENVQSYIDAEAKFYDALDTENHWKKLISVTFVDEAVDTYILVSKTHLNTLANGMLSNVDGLYGVLCNIFDFNENDVTYNAQQKADDITTYGTWEYDDEHFHYVNQNTYYAINLQYLSVAIGKGLLTPEELREAAEKTLQYNPEVVKEDLFNSFGIILGGTIQIVSNTAEFIEEEEVVASIENNLHMFNNGPKLTIGTGIIGNGIKTPEAGMKVGITLLDSGYYYASGSFTSNGTDDDLTYFLADDISQSVIFNTDHLEIFMKLEVEFDTEYEWGEEFVYGDSFGTEKPKIYYDNEELTDVDIKFVYYNPNPFEEGWIKLDEKPRNVGEYKVVIIIDSETYYGEQEYFFEIVKAELIVNIDDKTSVYGDDLVALTATCEGLKYDDDADDLFILETDATKESDAGEYFIWATPNNGALNYNVTYIGTYKQDGISTDCSTYTITKAKVDIPTANTGLIYNGTEQTGVEPPQDALFTITGNTETNAGTHTAIMALKDKTNYEWNLTTPTAQDQEIAWSIAKQEVEVPTIEDKTYTGSTLTADVEESTLYTVTENDGGINAGEYDVKLTLSDSVNYKWRTSENAEITLTFKITKATNTWVEELTITGWSYNSLANSPSAEAKFGTITYTYSNEYNGTYISDVPTNAGGYYVKAVVEGNNNFDGIEDIKLFEITRATNTITNLTQADVYCGDIIEPTATKDFGEIVYKFKLSNETDWLELTDTCYPTKVGTYLLMAEIAETNNYAGATCEPITFNVLAKEITKQDVEEEKQPEEGTKIDLVEGKLEENVVVVIAKENNDVTETVKANIKSAVTENSEIVAKFDIHLEKEGVKVENVSGNRYKVTLAVPENLQARTGLNIVYIYDEGNVQKYNSTILDNNTIVFETDHFSTWAIVADEIPAPTSTLNAGAIVGICLGSLLLLLIIVYLLGYFFLYRKGKLDDKKIKVIYKILPRGENNLKEEKQETKSKKTTKNK